MGFTEEEKVILEGSCHCRAVSYRVRSTTPYPFNRCYCAVCRKTAGGGGYVINIMGEADSLEIDGDESVSTYRASADRVDGGAGKDGLSHMRRHFCSHCGSALWASDPRWPEWVYPFASAIDTPLPRPAEHVHLMLGSKPDWVEVPEGSNHKKFEGYPDESITDWHAQRGLSEE
jgi:hypothetical protein